MGMEPRRMVSPTGKDLEPVTPVVKTEAQEGMKFPDDSE